jgi:hypothetical protein
MNIDEYLAVHDDCVHLSYFNSATWKQLPSQKQHFSPSSIYHENMVEFLSRQYVCK